jgi:phosphohistidine phosphatase SixA
MSELILLRHAHALESASSGRDFDRALSPRGSLQAEAAAAWLCDQVSAPRVLCSPARRTHETRVLCSPARRTHETLLPLLARWRDLEVQYDSRIYEATASDLLSVLDDGWSADAPVLLIGHNPGLETLLALLLSGSSSDYRGMSTASVARLALQSQVLEPGVARLESFWSP